MTDHANELLASLSEGLGLGALRFDSKRVCRLVFDDVHEVDLEQPEGLPMLFVHAVIARLPAGAREEIFRRCLIGNFFGSGTGDAMLCLDANRDEILLFRRLPLPETGLAELEAALLDFVGRMQPLKDVLAAAPASPVDAPMRGDDLLGFALV
jgi:hypothetical protein